MQKPQRPKKKEEELGQRRHDWKDWEKNYNQMTGLSCNRMFDVYQKNENVRVRNASEIKSIQKGIEKLDKTNRRQIETLREDYKVMMAYAYVYRLHSVGAAQNPDNDDIPLIRKRMKASPAQNNSKADPDRQILPENILDYYDERPKSFRLPPIERKWRPASFSGNVFEDNQIPGVHDFLLNDPYPTLGEEDIEQLQRDRDSLDNMNKTQLPAVGTMTLKLASWQNYGNQFKPVNKARPQRNAMSEPPSRWRGRERILKSRNSERPKSYMPESSTSVCKTPMTSKKFYDEEAKRVLPKLTASHRRIKESQKLLQVPDPFNKVIDSKKTTSAILREYRHIQKKQGVVKKGPVKVPHGENVETPAIKMFQNWIVCNNHSET